MIRGSCHCGNVSFLLKVTPEWLTECNCSICRRLGGMWAHADISEIEIESADDATFTYAWGDKTLAFHTCKSCGATTHWESLQLEKSTRMAVNCRMVDPGAIAGIRIRHFDGAESWTYLD